MTTLPPVSLDETDAATPAPAGPPVEDDTATPAVVTFDQPDVQPDVQPGRLRPRITVAASTLIIAAAATSAITLTIPWYAAVAIIALSGAAGTIALIRLARITHHEDDLDLAEQDAWSQRMEEARQEQIARDQRNATAPKADTPVDFEADEADEADEAGMPAPTGSALERRRDVIVQRDLSPRNPPTGQQQQETAREMFLASVRAAHEAELAEQQSQADGTIQALRDDLAAEKQRREHATARAEAAEAAAQAAVTAHEADIDALVADRAAVDQAREQIEQDRADLATARARVTFEERARVVVAVRSITDAVVRDNPEAEAAIARLSDGVLRLFPEAGVSLAAPTLPAPGTDESSHVAPQGGGVARKRLRLPGRASR